MWNVIKFLLFITYATMIFFLPNNVFIIIFVALNFIAMIIYKIQIKKVFIKSMSIMPFIIFTFLINWWLDSFFNALWIGLKLLIVCNITIVYSETTTISRYCRYNKNNMLTFKAF